MAVTGEAGPETRRICEMTKVGNIVEEDFRV